MLSKAYDVITSEDFLGLSPFLLCATSVEGKLWNSFLEFIFSVRWLILALKLYCIKNIINIF